MDHKTAAEKYFLAGFNCAQAVFAAYCDVTGLPEETALRLSSSFGGGMGKLREVCGACTGAFAVLGILYGYSAPDADAKAAHYALIRSFAAEFVAIHGTYICRELIAGISGTDSPAPAERNAEYYRVRPCLRYIHSACEILDGIISGKSKKC
mgnify:FL=1